MYEHIKKLIDDLYNDMSRDKEDILADLEGLRDEIGIMIENIESDIEKEK